MKTNFLMQTGDKIEVILSVPEKQADAHRLLLQAGLPKGVQGGRKVVVIDTKPEASMEFAHGDEWPSVEAIAVALCVKPGEIRRTLAEEEENGNYEAWFNGVQICYEDTLK